MNYLSVENLGKNYGIKVLFEQLNFGLSKGDKMALIANNGTGKSSLLKILVGKDTSDAGSVTYRQGLKVAYLAQEPDLDNEATIEELIQGANSEVLKVIRDYEAALLEQSENYSDASQRKFDLASAEMDKHEAWDHERRLKQILSRFNIVDLGQQVASLSGGQKKRLALGLVLLDNPDLLILDEPTNHLDVEMIEWLEKYLLQSNLTLLMVTHDRYFLDAVCNHILELHEGKLYHHKGSYAHFLEKKAERIAVANTEIDKAGKLMKKELEWMRRMPKARTTKSKSRINSFHETKEKATSGTREKDLKLQVKMSRMGGKILELKKVYKSYGQNVILKGFDYTFKKGDRIGIIGQNGVGKSTFLNIITDKESADSGKINVGETIVMGYYAKQGIRFKEDQRVIDVLKAIAEVVVMGDGSKLSAAQFLEHFLFPREMQYTQVAKLSGGERRRLHLLTVLIQNPNFLILDEPTNDLDLLTLNKLEEFLENFGGCLILVSHDRYFMDKLVDHMFVFKGEGEIKDFYGNYTELRLKQKQDEKQERERKPEAAKPIQSKQPQVKTKLTYKEKLEYEQLEKDIDALEKEKTELEAILGSGTTDYAELEKTTTRMGVVVKEIDEKTMRWMELDEFVLN